MSVEPPFFEEALRAAEAKISMVAGAEAKLGVYLSLDDRLTDIVELIDSQMFREELQYSRREITERGTIRGFTLFLCEVEKRPICFVMGYQDPGNEKGFYVDTLATVVGGKGIGSTILAAAMVYAWEMGYTEMSLHTEERDEKDRPLREFYEALGFDYSGTSGSGDLMRTPLVPEKVAAIYNRYVLGQRSPPPPVNG